MGLSLDIGECQLYGAAPFEGFNCVNQVSPRRQIRLIDACRGNFTNYGGPDAIQCLRQLDPASIGSCNDNELVFGH